MDCIEVVGWLNGKKGCMKVDGTRFWALSGMSYGRGHEREGRLEMGKEW